ncbi:hypothetical protein [Mucilaginibacter sp.]
MEPFEKRKIQLAQARQQLSEQVKASILHKQRMIADYLDRKTQYWNKTSKIILLVIIILLLGGMSLYLLLKANN